MKKLIWVFLLLLQVQLGFAQIVKEKSALPFAQTVKALETQITSRGLTIFTKIDHTKAAQKAKLKMQPAVVLIFGNPAVGTLLMNDNLAWSYELPLKIAVYEEATGAVWLSTRLLPQDISAPTQQGKIKNMNRLLKALVALKSAK